MTVGKRPCTRAHVLPSVCHCEPVLGGPRKGAPFAGGGAIRERCPALAFGRSRAWRTLGRRGVAIRVPAVRHNKSAVLWANPQLFRICRKELRSVLHYRRRTDCPVASLLAMTSINLPRFSTIRNRVLHTAFPAGGFPCCSFSCKDADCRSPCSFGYHCIIRPLI